MVVLQSLPLGFSGVITSKQNKKVDGVRIPGDMDYDYLRREIMFGTMSINTIVQIGYTDYYNNYAPLLYDQTDFFKVTEDDNDYDDFDDDDLFDDYDDLDDLENELDNLDTVDDLLASVSMSLNLGGNQGNSLNNAGNSTLPMLLSSAPAGQLTLNTFSTSQPNLGIGANLASQVSIGGNQTGQVNPVANDIIQEMYGFKSLTVLHVAMLLNDVGLLEFLLENKVDIMKSTVDCGPIIFLAIAMKKMEYVKRILDAGFLLDHRAYLPELLLCSTYTALEVAVKFNHYNIIEFLISRGAQVNVNESHALTSPMQIAATRGDVKMMKHLIDHGAVVNEKVLKVVCRSRMNLEALKFLLSNPAVKLTSGGIDRNDSKPGLPGFGGICNHANSILAVAMMCGSKQMVACILNAGADVNVIGKNGKMFYEAPGYFYNGCVDLIKEHLVKLIAAGLKVCDQNRKNVSGPEYTEFFAKCQDEVEIMKSTPVSGTDLTCYDLLHESEDELTVCLKHFDNCVVFDEVLMETFPLYGEMIASRFMRCTIQST